MRLSTASSFACLMMGLSGVAFATGPRVPFNADSPFRLATDEQPQADGREKSQRPAEPPLERSHAASKKIERNTPPKRLVFPASATPNWRGDNVETTKRSEAKFSGQSQPTSRKQKNPGQIQPVGTSENSRRVEKATYQPSALPPLPDGDENVNSTHDESVVVPPDPNGASPSMSLSLDDAIGMALSHNPTLGESVASIRQLQGEWNQTGFYPNPTVGYAAGEVGNDGAAGQQGIYLGQTFVTADKLDWNRAVAMGGVEFARAQSEAQRLRVLTDTATRFYEALGAQQLVGIAEKIRDNAQSGFSATESLVKAGESATADLLQAEAVLEKANVGVQQAQARQDAAWIRLATMIGQTGMSPIPLQGDLDVAPSEDDFEVIWQRLRSGSPELWAAKANISRTRAKIGREEAQGVPDLDAQNTVQYDYGTNSTIVGLQMSVAMPVYHQNEGSISAARAAHVRACREYERIELQLRDRLAQIVRDFEVANAQVVTYREKVVPAAVKSLDLVRKGYEQGEFDVLRLITSQQIYADASAQYVDALVDLRTAEAQINGLLLTGGLDEPIAPESIGGVGGLADVPRAE